MRYTEFRDAIQKELRQMPEGLTWVDLRDRLGLPYDRPCPTWIRQLEIEIGLSRVKGRARRLVWKVATVRKITTILISLTLVPVADGKYVLAMSNVYTEHFIAVYCGLRHGVQDSRE